MKFIKLNLILLSFVLLTGCLSKRLWDQSSYEEEILGTIKLEKDDTPIIVGVKHSYALTENRDSILKLFTEVPHMSINLRGTDITLDPNGNFSGTLALITLEKPDNRQQKFLENQSFDEHSNGKYSKHINISGHTVDVVNKDKVFPKTKNDKKVIIKLSDTNMQKAVKVVKTPIYISGDAALVGGMAGIGTAGMAVLLPIVFVAVAAGAAF
ncbi:MAG: hypothetical protein NE327_19200 [Lentisphaeraceae bacterium]|nr:hypothetical protein [Lentisphaeraceae bacterium]